MRVFNQLTEAKLSATGTAAVETGANKEQLAKGQRRNDGRRFSLMALITKIMTIVIITILLIEQNIMYTA